MSNMDVVTKAITLLTECYGQLGGEPDMELDLEGKLLNPASVELFRALEDFFETVTGLQDEQLREWIMTPTDLNQIYNNLKNSIEEN